MNLFKKKHKFYCICLSIFLVIGTLQNTAFASTSNNQSIVKSFLWSDEAFKANDSEEEMPQTNSEPDLSLLEINRQSSKDGLDKERTLLEEISETSKKSGGSGSGGGSGTKVNVPFDGGDGISESTPYLISTPEQLASIGIYSENTYFKLTQDITLTEEWQPIQSFNGILEGNKKFISGLTITEINTDNVGLFNTINFGAEVNNLTLNNISITGYLNVGGLAGNLLGSVSNCTVSGSATGISNVGGLIGFVQRNALINYCDSSVNIIGENFSGGLVGTADGANIKSCNASGSVNPVLNDDLSFIGGFAGALFNSNVDSCSASGAVTISYDNSVLGYLLCQGYVGGFAGIIGLFSNYDTTLTEIIEKNECTIINCTASGDVVSILDNTGGFAGFARDYSSIADATLTISNCSSLGNITVSGYKYNDYEFEEEYNPRCVGGFFGSMSNCKNVSNCKAGGRILTCTSNKSNYVGGFAGTIGSYKSYDLKEVNPEPIINMNITDCVSTYELTVKNGSQIGGFVGLVDSTNISGCSSIGAVSITGNENRIKGIGGFIGNGINSTFKKSFATGNVTTNTSVRGIAGFAGTLGYRNYSLLKMSIDDPVIFEECYSKGNVTLNGDGDGDGDGDYTRSDGVGGFLGYVEDAIITITCCYSTGNVTDSGLYYGEGIGGFLGASLSYDGGTNSINYCFSTGNVTSNGVLVGGFAGAAVLTNIANCYTYGNVKGNLLGTAGFIGGTKSSNFTNCFANTTVEGAYFAGGFAGFATGGCTFNQCNANGSVNAITTDSNLKSYTDFFEEGMLGIGGFIGFSNLDCLITNCYTKCDVTVSITKSEDVEAVNDYESGVSGFAGYCISSSITNSYSAGNVNTDLEEGVTISEFGPFFNTLPDKYTDYSIDEEIDLEHKLISCFYDSDVVGNDVSTKTTPNVKGITTEQAHESSTFTNAGWDFDSIWSIDNSYPDFKKLNTLKVVNKNNRPIIGATLTFNDVTLTTDSNGEVLLNKGYYNINMPFSNNEYNSTLQITDTNPNNLILDINILSGTISGISSDKEVTIILRKGNSNIETQTIKFIKNSIYYQFNDLANGKYSIEAKCNGYKSELIKTEVDSEDNEKNNFQLVEKKSSGGSGRKITDLSKEYTVTDSVIVHVKSFSDISENYSWAKKEIEALTQKGILNGTTDNSFSPGDSITRADFVVLLVRSLGFTGSTITNFDDVSPGTYYYNAVSIAKKLGIVTGNENRNFIPSEHISREDMMVLIARALKSAGITLGTGNSSTFNQYSDKLEVSEYAKDDVKALIQSGLIQGSDSTILPKNKLTRAEAAILFYRVMQKANRI